MREVKLVTVLNLVDIYCAVRQDRGAGHFAAEHSVAIMVATNASDKPRYDYAREVVPNILGALNSDQVQKAYSEFC
jgi:hypothetical protein